MSDAITILRAHGRRLCKTIAADGSVRGYDSARTFDMSERSVSNLDDLHAILADLASRPDRCIVRGAIADPERTRGVRRLLHDDGADLATLVDVPRWWCALDIDGMPLPKGCDASDVFSCGIAAILALPAEFHGAGFVAQATGSHGLKPGMRLRLWCWLSRPTTGAELAFWLRGVPHLDRASFSAAQIIYVASPLFEAGQDALRTRIVLAPGPGVVRVPPAEALQPPPPPPPRPMPEIGNHAGASYARAALAGAATRIMAAGEGNRHRTILREARSLQRLVDAGVIDESHARHVIETAAQHAGKSDDREIAGLWAWAAAHPSGGAAHV